MNKEELTEWNIYRCSQTEVTYPEDEGVYFDMVVIARTEDEARNIHPLEQFQDDEDFWDGDMKVWASKPENVNVELLGRAIPSALSMAGFRIVTCSTY